MQIARILKEDKVLTAKAHYNRLSSVIPMKRWWRPLFLNGCRN